MENNYQDTKTIKGVLNLLDDLGLNTSPNRAKALEEAGKDSSCRISVFANNDEEELRKLRLK